MSTRQQQPTVSPVNSNQFSDSDRGNSVLHDRTVVYDRAAQERVIQEKAARDSFQQGYVEGRERAAQDYANLSAQIRSQPEPNGAGTTLGILFGILMTAVIGGSIAASFYFDGRIDALRNETESLSETLEDQNNAIGDGETEDGNPFSNLFQREEASEYRGFEAAPSEQPAESSSPQVESETIPTEPSLPEVGDIENDASEVDPEANSEVIE